MRKKTFIIDLGLLVGCFVISPISIIGICGFIQMAFEQESLFECIGFLLFAIGCFTFYYFYSSIALRFLTVSDRYIVLRAFCRRTVKIKYEDIKDIRIETLSDSVYHNSNRSVDADTWIAITASSFDNRTMRKIHISYKKKTLKFPVKQAMCEMMLENLKKRGSGKNLTGELEYMIFRYENHIRL